MLQSSKRIFKKALNILLAVSLAVGGFTIPTNYIKALASSAYPCFTNVKVSPYSGVGLNYNEAADKADVNNQLSNSELDIHEGIVISWENTGADYSWCEVVISEHDLGCNFNGNDYDPTNPDHVALRLKILNDNPRVRRHSICYNDPFYSYAFLSTDTDLYISSTNQSVGKFQYKPGVSYYFYVFAYQSAAQSGVEGGRWFIAATIRYNPVKYLSVIPNGMQNTLKFSFTNHNTPPENVYAVVGTIQRFDDAKALTSWSPSVSYNVYKNNDGTYRATKTSMTYEYGSNGYALNANKVEVTDGVSPKASVVSKQENNNYPIGNYNQYCTIEDLGLSETAPNSEPSYYRYVFISYEVNYENDFTLSHIESSEYAGPQVSYTESLMNKNASIDRGSITFTVNKYPLTRPDWASIDDLNARYKWTVCHVSSTDVNTCDQVITFDGPTITSGAHTGAGECGSNNHSRSFITTTAVLGGCKPTTSSTGIPAHDAITGAVITNNDGSIVMDPNTGTGTLTFHFADLVKTSSLFRRKAIISTKGISFDKYHNPITDANGNYVMRDYALDNLIVPGKTYAFSFISCYRFNAQEHHPESGAILSEALDYYATTVIYYTPPVRYFNGDATYSSRTTNWVGLNNHPINVTVSWSSMEFNLVGTWNPEEHKYSYAFNEAQNGSSVINVTNNGKAKITVTGGCSVVAEHQGKIGCYLYDPSLTGTDRFWISATKGVDVAANGGSKDLRVFVHAPPETFTRDVAQTFTNGGKIASVTITINEKLSYISSVYPNRS